MKDIYHMAYQQLLFLSENRDMLLEIIPTLDDAVESYWRAVLDGRDEEVAEIAGSFRVVLAALPRRSSAYRRNFCQ